MEGKINPAQNSVMENFMAYACSPEIEFDEIGSDGVIFQHEEFGLLIQYCRQHPDKAEAVVEEVINKLPGMDVFKASVAALCVGTITEGGVACPSSPKLVDYFVGRTWRCVEYLNNVAKMLDVPVNDLEPDTLYKTDRKSLYRLDEEGYKTFMGSCYLIMSVMSRICRERSLREYLRGVDSISDLCDFLSQFEGAYGYIYSVLEMAEEEDIIILSPEKQLGLEVTIRQLDSNFLFFSLFQLEMHRQGWLEKLGVQNYKYDPLRDKQAHNLLEEAEEGTQEQDHACMEYYTYKAYQPDGTYSVLLRTPGGIPQVNPETRVWGEGNIYEIPRLDDRIVILVDSHPLMNRSWGQGFTTPVHGAIRPEVTFKRQLTSDEFNGWMQRVKEMAN